MKDLLQIPLFEPKSSWSPPSLLPNLMEAKEMAIDLETRDPNIRTNGPGWATGEGEVVGVTVVIAKLPASDAYLKNTSFISS